MNTDDIRRLVMLVAMGDPSAADEIDRMADKLRSLAARLRSGTAVNPNRSMGGASDRVQMRVTGPDGELKHETDTDPKRGNS